MSDCVCMAELEFIPRTTVSYEDVNVVAPPEAEPLPQAARMVFSTPVRSEYPARSIERLCEYLGEKMQGTDIERPRRVSRWSASNK